jgi:hypothetical protein
VPAEHNIQLKNDILQMPIIQCATGFKTSGFVVKKCSLTLAVPHEINCSLG